ncbi:MAG TPA: hypothetical protein VLW17_15720 [Thermoanaerobaculaceae bacterium]|nr:hypothetical protein [Thermoanaerobaculaceae bacterium]
MAYLDLDGDRLKVVHCGDEACAAGNAVAVVDGSSCIAEATSVAIGNDGLPVIAYGAAIPALKLVHCGDPGCTSGNVVTTVEPGGAHGLHPTLRIGADGPPVISYYGANGSLTLAHCRTPTCEAAALGRIRRHLRSLSP